MAYIGPAPNPGQNREVDDISSGFNGGTASFTLQVNGQNVSPGSSNAIIVSLGGVVQNPGTDYTVAGSTITFTTNPASGLSFFGLVLGQQVDTEGFADGGTLNNPVITGDLSIADKIVHTGDTNTAIRFPANDTISFETSGGEQLRISSSGQVLSGLTTAHSTVLANQTPKIQLESTSVSGSSMFLLRDGNDAGGPFLFLGHGRGGSGLVQSGDELGQITFVGGEGSNFQNAAAIKSFVDGTAASGTDMPGRLAFFTSPDGSTTMSERMRINNSGNVGIGNTDPTQARAVFQSDSGTQLALIKDNTGASLSFGGVTQPRILVETGTSSSILRFYEASGSSYGSPNFTERLRMFNNAASVYIGRASAEVTVSSSNDSFSEGVGVTLAGGGNSAYNIFAANNTTTMYVARRTTDGALIEFYHNTGNEGNISVSGSTVSYNGGHLSRWSQLTGISETDKSARPEIYQGTVMSNLDELCVWSHPDVLYTEQDKIDGSIPDGKDVGDVKEAAHTEDNQQLNKTKVSDTAGDKDVAGVFWAWDDDDDEYVNDFYIAMTGDMVIRVAASTTVARGDLLISAGDGTAKPQADDIVRSSTIAKIISTNHTATYPDGSKAYPCVLMAC